MDSTISTGYTIGAIVKHANGHFLVAETPHMDRDDASGGFTIVMVHIVQGGSQVCKCTIWRLVPTLGQGWHMFCNRNDAQAARSWECIFGGCTFGWPGTIPGQK
eukprot:1147917-Pelagomonas_calceolata.AAC.4